MHAILLNLNNEKKLYLNGGQTRSAGDASSACWLVPPSCLTILYYPINRQARTCVTSAPPLYIIGRLTLPLWYSPWDSAWKVFTRVTERYFIIIQTNTHFLANETESGRMGDYKRQVHEKVEDSYPTSFLTGIRQPPNNAPEHQTLPIPPYELKHEWHRYIKLWKHYVGQLSYPFTH